MHFWLGPQKSLLEQVELEKDFTVFVLAQPSNVYNTGVQYHNNTYNPQISLCLVIRICQPTRRSSPCVRYPNTIGDVVEQKLLQAYSLKDKEKYRSQD
jgi:hypothetical protein